MAKAAFDKKMALFTSNLDLNLRNKLVKWYIWSLTLHGAENWTLDTWKILKCCAGEYWRILVGRSCKI